MKRDLEQWLGTAMSSILHTSKETYMYEKRPTYMTNNPKKKETNVYGKETWSSDWKQ